jgi:hypothetical protein
MLKRLWGKLGGNGNVAAARFLQRLQREIQRSLRYNHFCTIAVFASYRTSAHRIYRRVRSLLRETDFVAVVDVDNDEGAHMLRSRGGAMPQAANGLPSRRVVAILPETNREGAGCALARLRGALLGAGDVMWGSAVYPDDATTPKALLNLAEPRNA